MLDFDALNAYLDNDRDVIYAVLSTYQEDHGNSLQEIEELVQQQDWGKLHFTVHTLKGILASFGEETATVALERVEQNTLNKLAPQDDDLSVIYSEMKIINQQIDEVLSTYQSIELKRAWRYLTADTAKRVEVLGNIEPRLLPFFSSHPPQL